MRERVPTPLVVAHQRVVVEREGWRCFQDSREHDYLRAFCLELAWDRRYLLQSLEEGSRSRLIASSFVFDEENPVLSHPHAYIFVTLEVSWALLPVRCFYWTYLPLAEENFIRFEAFWSVGLQQRGHCQIISVSEIFNFF